MPNSIPDRSGAPGVAWRPGAEQLERSRIARFLRAHAIVSLDALRRRAIEDPEWFWRAVSDDIGIRWLRALRPRARRLAQDPLAELVPRRPAELRG
jgi:hypothetical protein